MIEKNIIINKLENFFKKTKADDFLKVFIITFLSDKINFLEKIVGNENAINMLDKYIYNLEHNLNKFIKLEKYHSIYVKYDFKSKTLKYFITDDYKKINLSSMHNKDKKNFIIKEFKIMMYKELEHIINIYSSNDIIISNGFYIKDKAGRYTEYEGDFSNIIDIFSDFEVCKILNIDDKVKTYIDLEKEYFVYSRHISQRNSEVLCYIELLRFFIDEKFFYFAMNNPQKYTEKMIKNFDAKYEFVLNKKNDFLLRNESVFALIENYLLHIRNRINREDYNIKYHQDLSTIFKLMNEKNHINNLSYYILHNKK